MNRYHVTVYGRVQGVGFRYFVYMKARKLNVTGWIYNSYNENIVEMEVQGSNEAVDTLLIDIKKGNGFSTVENMNIEVTDVIKNEKSFRIKY